MSRKVAVGISCSTILIVGIAAGTWYALQPDSEQLLRQARRELAKSHFSEAEKLANRAAQAARPSPWAHLVAAEAAFKSGQMEAALEHYRQVPDGAGDATVAGRFGAGEVQIHLGQLQAGEASLRRVLEIEPNHTLTHYRLAYLLSVSGRRWQATPHLFLLVQAGVAEMSHLLLLGNGQQLIDDQGLLDTARKVSPDDPWPALAQARRQLALNETTKARVQLRPIQVKYPLESEIQVRWGQLLLAMRQTGEFQKWNAAVAKQVEEHPELWVLRGTYALQLQQPRQAARCFWEAVRRDSEHHIANYRLGQTLTSLGDQQRALPFLQRADLLQQLAIVLDDIFNAPTHVASMQKASYLTERLGRFWEAHAWAVQAWSKDQSLVAAQKTALRLQPRLSPDLPRIDAEHQAFSKVDLTDLALPDPRLAAPVSLPSAESASKSVEQFRDDSRTANVEFQFFNSEDSTSAGAHIFETTGGGVGVLDYDGDGWPDLYFTQGAVKPAMPGAVAYLDQFFRNGPHGRFDNVTSAARLGDPDYSQGLTVGDFDNDGFADLYVANFGANRLYHNNGDGTFSDVTGDAGIGGNQWTTSCLMADLNGDSWPDLYDVNYVGGSNVETLLCAREGKTRSCSPRAFDAAPDQLWLSQGDGRFVDVTAQSGIDIPNGYGLGIVAADLTGAGRLSLFIANDEVPNFLFAPTDAPPGGTPNYVDQALIAGVAVDADGLSQACMGVAAGDANDDGLLDLFVTNFYNESNTLYRQLSAGSFVDETRAAGLRDPSFSMLGFGTQFLDGDLDGHLDLVLTNGHIDDLSSIGQPYKMPPQYFHNQGQGRYREVSAGQLGPFFEGKYLGRGLSRVDWNRDGREDFVVSHMNAPAALVTNTTETANHFLAVKVRGSQTSRDAIGATIRLKVGSQQRTAQLTGGDGYHASNERQLLFGLGTDAVIDELTIRWPRGTTQTWKNLAADRELLFIEGQDRMWEMGR